MGTHKSNFLVVGFLTWVITFSVTVLNPISMGSRDRLKIACWNVRGYLSSIPYIRKLLTDVDVLAISEHWLHRNKLNILHEISDTHYVFGRASNLSPADSYGLGRGQGGVALFWRKEIAGFSKVTNIIHDRVCVLRYEPQRGDVFLFISVYLPAQGSDEDLRAVLDDLSEIVDSREAGAHVCILGDFNGDVGSHGGPRGTRAPTQRGRYVLEFFNRHGVIAINMQELTQGPVDTFESHNGKSTIDYIVIPAYMRDRVHECRVNEWDVLNTSDHLDIHMTLSIKMNTVRDPEPLLPGRVKWEKDDVRRKYYHRTQHQIRELCDRMGSCAPTSALIDEYFEALSGILHESTADLVRTKYVPHYKPYWNNDLSRLKRTKVQTYRAWVDSGRPREPDNPLMVAYKSSKKVFALSIKRIAKQYENEEICRAVKLAEIDRNSFWRLIKRCRNSDGAANIAIRDHRGVVVSEVNAVLGVWRRHFANLGTPQNKTNFDDQHYNAVTEFVRLYNEGRANDDNFLNDPFSIEEIRTALSNLNRGKAPGADMVSAEHIVYAGECIEQVLMFLYNSIVTLEDIPSCFRSGVQIPLFKGKDLDILDPNSYRGITLLSTFHKIFEILIWNRLKYWWTDENVISELQGACKTGLSCVHTAFILQETLAASMEDNEQCFLAFFDVAKAFDTVWTDGLFRQVYDLGITGKTWRLLYRGYVNFQCRVRICGQFSEPYGLFCGIHQGGYLSLLKYTVFINSLLVSLRDSGLCAKVYRTPSNPLGYADDLAACCVTKRKTDAVMEAVYQHGCTWRYDFNARKSGVLVFGESDRERQTNARNRVFKLGPAKVKEVREYDHVGVRTSVDSTNCSGLEDRIGKARRALNAISGLGIRKNGLNMSTCNIIFWTIVVPIALFGCELWRMDGHSINILESFQIYAGKRLQRFHPRSPNMCSFIGLGWMRLFRIVQVRKLLFIRSIMVLDDKNLSRKIFIERATKVFDNEDEHPLSEEWSIVADLLHTADIFNLTDEIRNMVLRGQMYSKSLWKTMVWKRGWSLEDTYWRLDARLHKELDLILRVCSETRYLIWWNLSNIYPDMIMICETMARILCHSSLLKCDDIRLKNLSHVHKVCSLCDHYSVENATHFIMQCPGTQHLRNEMLTELESHHDIHNVLRDNANDVMLICLGKCPDDNYSEVMVKLWCISGRHINIMYRYVLNQRKGIG